MNLKDLAPKKPNPDQLQDAIKHFDAAQTNMTPTEFNLRGLQRRRESATATVKEKLAIGATVVAAAVGGATLVVKTAESGDATQTHSAQITREHTPTIEQDREQFEGISAPAAPPQTYTLETHGK